MAQQPVIVCSATVPGTIVCSKALLGVALMQSKDITVAATMLMTSYSLMCCNAVHDVPFCRTHQWVSAMRPRCWSLPTGSRLCALCSRLLLRLASKQRSYMVTGRKPNVRCAGSSPPAALVLHSGAFAPGGVSAACP